VPANSTARVYVPNAAAGKPLYMDGRAVRTVASGGYLRVDELQPGCHIFTTRPGQTVYHDNKLTTVCPNNH
jgi:alpha-L-rhamnosidase